MAKLTAYIVGMHFRPPAKDVVNLLPAGTPLLIQREPSNEYDEFAVKVILPGFHNEPPPVSVENTAESAAYDIRKAMIEDGGYGEDLLNPKDGLLHIAYVDSKKTGLAKMFSQDMLTAQIEAESDYNLYFDAELQFDLAGKPMVATDLTISDQPSYEVDRNHRVVLEDDEDDNWGD